MRCFLLSRVTHKRPSLEHVLYYVTKTKIPTKTAKKITHFPKMTLLKKVNDTIGVHPLTLLEEVLHYIKNMGGVYFQTLKHSSALKRTVTEKQMFV